MTNGLCLGDWSTNSFESIARFELIFYFGRSKLYNKIIEYQSTNRTLPAATVPLNPALKTKVKAILKIKSSGIASTKQILTRPKVPATNRQ
ncbi:MAG: hypothetical protein P2A85_08220 [Microcoleus anatoxicus]|uniref:hypothetical protein n=1 Tax=Microcoleus anatoxicus TaxID=2705319 RepID=UPI00366E809C